VAPNQSGCSLSELVQLISGVIQDHLFLIFINDLAFFLDRYHITLKLFAYDAKVYADIVDVRDVVELQNALDALADWAHT